MTKGALRQGVFVCEIGINGRIFTRLGVLMDIMDGHHPFHFCQIWSKDDQETSCSALRAGVLACVTYHGYQSQNEWGGKPIF